jgi:thioredoxin 1
MVVKITDENFESVVMNSEKHVLIDFYATWCGPCQMVSPIVDEIAEENPQYVVGKIDVDEQQQLAMRFGIVSIPTLICVKNGKIAAKQVGFATKDKILEMLK